MQGNGSSFLCKQKHKLSKNHSHISECSRFMARSTLLVHMYSVFPGPHFKDELHVKTLAMDHRCVGISHVILKNSFFVLRVDKKRDKIERKILDSQERAFWDVHRPVVSDVTDSQSPLVLLTPSLSSLIKK